MFKHIQYATFYQRKGIGIYKDVCVCVCLYIIYILSQKLIKVLISIGKKGTR